MNNTGITGNDGMNSEKRLKNDALNDEQTAEDTRSSGADSGNEWDAGVDMNSENAWNTDADSKSGNELDAGTDSDLENEWSDSRKAAGTELEIESIWDGDSKGTGSVEEDPEGKEQVSPDSADATLKDTNESEESGQKPKELKSSEKEEMPETLLFTSSLNLTWENYKKTNREVSGRTARLQTFWLIGIALLCGSYFLATDLNEVGWIIFLIAITVLIASKIRRAKALRAEYRNFKEAHGPERTYAFYTRHLEVADKKPFNIEYADIYRILETKDMFYLAKGKRAFIPVEKTAPELTTFLRGLEKQSKKSPLFTAVQVLGTVMILMLSAALLFYAFRPQRDIIRLWVLGMLYIPFILAALILVLIGVGLNRHGISRVKKKGKRVFFRVLSIVITGAFAVDLTYSGISSFLSACPGYVKNANGTYTLSSPYLEITDHWLFEEDGPLYLRYLRQTTGAPDDTDPTISELEWSEQHNRLPRYDSSVNAGIGNEVNGTDSDSVSEPDPGAGSDSVSGVDSASGLDSGAGSGSLSGSDSTSESNSTSKSNQGTNTEGAADKAENIYAGYLKLFTTYFAEEGNTFMERTNAKGEYYYVLLDRDSEIRYLLYDRTSENGQCALYVLYRQKKDPDGNTTGEPEMLNIYAYNVYTGDTAASGKTTWSDPSSEKYRDLSGEE